MLYALPIEKPTEFCGEWFYRTKTALYRLRVTETFQDKVTPVWELSKRILIFNPTSQIWKTLPNIGDIVGFKTLSASGAETSSFGKALTITSDNVICTDNVQERTTKVVKFERITYVQTEAAIYVREDAFIP